MKPLVALALLLLALPAPARTATVLETYTDVRAFVARLGGPAAVQTIDFDDIATPADRDEVVAFDADRYEAATGAVIRSLTDEGQYASRGFGFREFRPVSGPNVYAPGPVAAVSGTNTTTVVTFSAAGAPGIVAGFGCFFVDADYPNLGPSSLRVFDADGAPLGSSGVVAGKDGSRLFRGLVAVDDAEDVPVFAIARAEVVSGNEWPAVDFSEGVVLDDFTFSAVPEAPGGLLLACTGVALGLREAARTKRWPRHGRVAPQPGTAAQ